MSLFHDPVQQEEFDRRGFTVVRLLDGPELSEVRARVDEVRRSATGSSCSAVLDQSFCTPDGNYRRRAHAIASEAIGDRLLGLLDRYRLLGSGVMTKLPGAGPMGIHRDRDILSNQTLVAVNAWCPLIDVDEMDGNLAMLPGSHRLPNVETDGVPRFYEPYGDALRPLCVSVPLSAGEAILFDNRLLHWSWPNRSEGDRPVLRAVAVPKDSRVVYYRLDAASGGTRFEMLDAETGPDGALTHAPDEMAKPGFVAPIVGYAPNLNRAVSLRKCKAQLDEALGRTTPGFLGRVTAAVDSLRTRLTP